VSVVPRSSFFVCAYTSPGSAASSCATFECAVDHGVGRERLVERAQPHALGRVDQPVAEHEHARGCGRQLGAHDPDRSLGVGHAHLDLGEAVLALGRGDAMVAAHGEHEPARDRVPGDRADDRAGQPVDAERHLVDPVDQAALLRWAVVGDRLEVEPGREEAGPAGQHERRRWRLGQLPDRLDELLQQPDVHGVRRRTVGGQHRDPVPLGERH
jgi:hypothetical protein